MEQWSSDGRRFEIDIEAGGPEVFDDEDRTGSGYLAGIPDQWVWRIAHREKGTLERSPGYFPNPEAAEQGARERIEADPSLADLPIVRIG